MVIFADPGSTPTKTERPEIFSGRIYNWGKKGEVSWGEW